MTFFHFFDFFVKIIEKSPLKKKKKIGKLCFFKKYLKKHNIIFIKKQKKVKKRQKTQKMSDLQFIYPCSDIFGKLSYFSPTTKFQTLSIFDLSDKYKKGKKKHKKNLLF